MNGMRGLFVIGSVGLLGAMLVDAAAVVGRHIGVPLLGSIELAEACVVLMASASLVATTLERGHASVHIFTERLRPRAKERLQRVTSLLSAAFFALILAGSVIVAGDLWHGDERSELLEIPIAPLRLFWCLSAAGVVATFIAQAVSRRSSS
jgi:TRAP-type transport system small permease protein